MNPSRRTPHCRTCHKPLKGHKRGVCNTTDTSSNSLDVTPPRSASTRKPGIRARKSEPLPLEALPALSPHSSEILNNILRKDSYSAPPPPQVPSVSSGKRTLRNASAGLDAESLHVALESLSASDEKSKTQAEIMYAPTEVNDEKDPELRAARQTSTFEVSQQLGLQPSNQTPTLVGRTSSAAEVSFQLQLESSASDFAPADVTIQNFLDTTAQSSHHQPATVFSFPADAVPTLKEGAKRLGLFVHVLPLQSANEDWVVVVVGRDASAVGKLLEDSEKLSQAVRESGGSTSVGEFRMGMSHIVAGTLGALATWAGLAYS